MFTSILSDTNGGLTFLEGGLCTLSALALGLCIAYIYSRLEAVTKNFTMTLAILPALVCFTILMVNGNLGTGVAVLGAFSLVRFRSLPGSSREISFIFFAMSIGLALGMGYVSFALFMVVVISIMTLIVPHIPFTKDIQKYKELKIILPEDLDYTSIFDDIFAAYTKKAELVRVKTIQLGTLIETVYHVELQDLSKEKEMIDKIRCRNGNLSVVMAKRQVMQDAL